MCRSTVLHIILFVVAKLFLKTKYLFFSVCKIWYYRGDYYEEHYFLGCDAV